MRLRIALISGLVGFAATNGLPTPANAGFFQSIGESQSSQAHVSIADTRENSLACLPGKFLVVGQEPDSGPTYSGSVSVTRQGDRLLNEKTIEGKLISGTGVIMLEPETPVLEVKYRVGSHSVTAGYEFRCGDQHQPRASGWVSPLNAKPILETWFYDW